MHDNTLVGNGGSAPLGVTVAAPVTWTGAQTMSPANTSSVPLRVVQPAGGDVDVLDVSNSDGSLNYLSVDRSGNMSIAESLTVAGNTNGATTLTIEGNASVSGALQLATPGTPPACSTTNSGALWFAPASSGAQDHLEVCAKDASDSFSWRVIY
jgi:hypothetical protein